MTGRRKSFKARAPVLVDTGEATVTATDRCVLEIDDIVEGLHRVNFQGWCGRGIDEWVNAIVSQLRAFSASEAVTRRTVLAYARSGAVHFLEFLATAHPSTPGDLNRSVLERFIAWLTANPKLRKSSTRKTIYSNTKSILRALIRRGVVRRQPDLFPSHQFPRSHLEVDSAIPLSQSERVRLAEAIKKDVIALHHSPDRFEGADALVVYALALAVRTGLNTSPMLELKRDALSKHPVLPRLGLLKSFKRRKHSEQWTTLKRGEPIERTATVPIDGLALFEKLLERTAPLAESAPDSLRDVVWLYETASRNKRGQLRRLTSNVLYERIEAFIRRHHLQADDGGTLLLNNRRMRATMENRLWRLSNGDLFTVAQVMGHQPRVADQHYLAVTDEMRAHAAIVGEALPAIYRGGDLQESDCPPVTPVGRCKDSLFGDFAPKDGIQDCIDFLSCFRCRSYALVGTLNDLHRLFSFYWHIQSERDRLRSREWRDYLTQIMRMIDAFTLDRFDLELVTEAKEKARRQPLRFWKGIRIAQDGSYGT